MVRDDLIMFNNFDIFGDFVIDLVIFVIDL